jgi:hypothetical protein
MGLSMAKACSAGLEAVLLEIGREAQRLRPGMLPLLKVRGVCGEPQGLTGVSKRSALLEMCGHEGHGNILCFMMSCLASSFCSLSKL